MSKRIKSSVKKAVAWIGNFETTAAEIAIDQNIDVVICGHIHQPQMRTYSNENGSVEYLNSGDWLENCTALEYNNYEWRLHYQLDEDEEEELQNLYDDENLKSKTGMSFYEDFFKNLQTSKSHSTIFSI